MSAMPNGWPREGTSLGLKWIEKPLPPDDYWVYADLRRKLGGTTWLNTGEHESNR